MKEEYRPENELWEEDDLDAEHQQEDSEEEEKKDHVIANKLAFVVLCIFVFLIPVLWFFGIGYPVNADGVFVGEIRQTEEGKLEIPMMLEGSAVAFTITTQELEEDRLILKPRFALVGLHQSGSTTVETKVPADELQEVWIQGDDENDRQLIWEKED
ncbi:MAG: hypothetical protein J6A26_06595 [Oscillospiraceae bacterium]|nr:hypothetical protein [Oscillospiraceae bacterium]